MMKKLIGYILFYASFIALTAIAILPFLNLPFETGSEIIAIIIIGAEIAFFLSIPLLGKEFLEIFKNLFRRFTLKHITNDKNTSPEVL